MARRRQPAKFFMRLTSRRGYRRPFPRAVVFVSRLSYQVGLKWQKRPSIATIASRAAQNRLRRLKRPRSRHKAAFCGTGALLVNFASNDYLGLSQHPALIEAACADTESYGAGVAASRLVTGEHPAFAALEARIADAKNQTAALVMASGYQTNLTAVAALADKEVAGRPVTILADRLAHHSLLQGALLSGARLMRFQHNDCDHLESLLRARSGKGDFCLIVTESVFGMDGDLADLARLGALAREFDALLYVDEAHATGVFGARGFGLCEDFSEGVDVAMGTFGKALGGFGSYLACAPEVGNFLIQRCGGLVYSTGLPPAALGAIDAALTLVPEMAAERQNLLAQAAAFAPEPCGAGLELRRQRQPDRAGADRRRNRSPCAGGRVGAARISGPADSSADRAAGIEPVARFAQRGAPAGRYFGADRGAGRICRRLCVKGCGVRLVFVHGWALGPEIWDLLAPKLAFPRRASIWAFSGRPPSPRFFPATSGRPFGRPALGAAAKPGLGGRHRAQFLRPLHSRLLRRGLRQAGRVAGDAEKPRPRRANMR